MAKQGLLAEFKEFLTTGDLMSVAVAFVMGAATKAVIDSFVGNIFNGILGIFLPKSVSNLKDLALGPLKDNLKDPTKPATEAGNLIDRSRPLKYGAFIDDIIKFVILSFVVFMIVKAYKKATAKALASDGPSTNDLLAEIRDSLAKR
jgi:large conductance mechanosensitive channel